MKIPAIRATIGNKVYYTTTLTFQQVSDYISPINNELHKSNNLKELIQRSVTSNYLSIKDYILNQPERFFNALILAVYDDYPKWREIEFKYNEDEFYQMGILEFESSHKIFPVDGQHRVEGIKTALLENPELGNEKIAAIFISHKNTEEGMRETRRLFSTLNRYAKPVTMDDIIALDEDDSAAIVTRELLENFDLFMDDQISKSGNKAINENDKKSFTSIITLYQCNKEILKQFRIQRKNESPNSERDKKSLADYLKFRPQEEEIDLFSSYCLNFWTAFKNNFNVIQEYINSNEPFPASTLRNKDNGGHLLFRPVGLLPFVQAIVEIHKRTNHSFNHLLQEFSSVNFLIAAPPWKNIVWNPNDKTMIMGNQALVKLILIYIYQTNIMKTKELSKLKQLYASKNLLPEDTETLSEIPTIN